MTKEEGEMEDYDTVMQEVARLSKDYDTAMQEVAKLTYESSDYLRKELAGIKALARELLDAYKNISMYSDILERNKLIQQAEKMLGRKNINVIKHY